MSKGNEHIGRCAPDPLPTVVKLDKREFSTVELSVDEPVIRIVHEMFERYLEGVFDFGVIDNHLNLAPHETDDRRYGKPRDRWHGAQVADDIDLLRLDSDLLVGLAQGSGANVVIMRFHAPSGKTDLASVVFKMRRTLRKEYRQAPGALYEWHQYAGRRQWALQFLLQSVRPTAQAGGHYNVERVLWDLRARKTSTQSLC